jgi:hypothetical protein
MTKLKTREGVEIKKTEISKLRRSPWTVSRINAPAPMQSLGGLFAIRTDLKGQCLTAMDGGGRTTDVIHTNAHLPLAWEEFKFWTDGGNPQHLAFQTATGNFLTAVDDGGRISDTIHSDATVISTWEIFQLLPQSLVPDFAIQTLKGYFLTAVGGGGHNSGETIHTDALKALEWERFNIVRRLDFGTGSTYGIISAFNPKNGDGTIGSWLVADEAGNEPGNNAISFGAGIPIETYWTLLKQSDGTYAFQTASGRVLTANEGGLAGFRTDTPVEDIGNFEKFTIVDNGEGSNFTALIKTYSGLYLAAGNDQSIVTVDNPNGAINWQFQLFSL